MGNRELTNSNARIKEARFLAPAVDIFEDEEGLTLAADLPGLSAEDLDIAVDKGLLTIEGAAAKVEEEESSGRGFSTPAYYRRFQLPETVDAERVEASIKDGVLTLRLPRAEAAKPKKIEVRMLN